MKSYTQGLITGGVLVFAFIVLTGQSLRENYQRSLAKKHDKNVRELTESKLNNPVGKYIYGMESMNDDFYYAWITNTQSGEVVIRKVSSLEKDEIDYFALSWKALVKAHNNQ